MHLPEEGALVEATWGAQLGVAVGPLYDFIK